MSSSLLLGIVGLGPTELVIVGLVGLLLFGSRLPSVMRNLGRGMHEFKHGLREVQDEVTAEARS